MFDSIIRDSQIKLLEVKTDVYAPSHAYHTDLFKGGYDSAAQTGTINGQTVKFWTKAIRERREEEYSDQVTFALFAALMFVVFLCAAPIFTHYALYGMACGLGWFLYSCAGCGQILDQVRQQEVVQIQEIWTEVMQKGLSGYEKKVCDVFVSKALPQSSPALNLYKDFSMKVSDIEEQVRQEFAQQLENNPSAVQQGVFYFRSIKNGVAISNLKLETIISS